jgi:hypothetical protein
MIENASAAANKNSNSLESNANSALAALAEGVTQLENSLSSGMTSMLSSFPGKRRRHHSNSTVRMHRRAELLNSAGTQHKTPAVLVAVISDTNDHANRVVVRNTWGRFANIKYWEEKAGSEEKEGNAVSPFRRERETAGLVDLRFFTTGLADWTGDDVDVADEILSSDIELLKTRHAKASYAEAMISLLKWALKSLEPFQYLLIAPHGNTAYLRLPVILDELLEITHGSEHFNRGSLYWGHFAARQSTDSTFREY